MDLALLNDQLDPVYIVNREPIVSWCKGIWDFRVPRLWMVRAWMAATKRLVGAKNPWSVVHGPAGAVLATLKRIGWEPVNGSALVWETQFG